MDGGFRTKPARSPGAALSASQKALSASSRRPSCPSTATRLRQKAGWLGNSAKPRRAASAAASWSPSGWREARGNDPVCPGPEPARVRPKEGFQFSATCRPQAGLDQGMVSDAVGQGEVGVGVQPALGPDSDARCRLSRTPPREAVRVLAREGMLDLSPHRGAAVAMGGHGQGPTTRFGPRHGASRRLGRATHATGGDARAGTAAMGRERG